jgi:signal peptidase I
MQAYAKQHLRSGKTIIGVKRNAWVAAGLSLLAAGLGQIYVGRARRGLVLWLASIALAFLGIVLVVVLPSAPALIALALLIVSPLILIAIDAAKLARSADTPFPLRRYNRWYVYAGLAILLGFIVQPAIFHTVRLELLQAFHLPSESMAPTYVAGDYVLVAPLRHPPKRGDIVVYRAEAGSFLKRIVGTPGDTISMASGRLIVNRDTISEPYASADTIDPVASEFSWQRAYLAASSTVEYRPSLHNWGPLRVPDGSYFLLGDSRSNSLDSRYLGFTPRDSILAYPVAIYLSWDASRQAVRWRRLGRAPL